MSASWLEVPGWLSPAEGHALGGLGRARQVLELGTYLGRSTCCLAQAGAKRVVTIDHHRGDQGTGPADTWLKLLDNLDRCGVRDRVVPIRGEIGRMALILPRHSFGLVYIDSAHDEDSVLRDTEIALLSVAKGGLLAWHDSQYDSVRSVQARLDLEPTGSVESLTWMFIS